MAEQSDRVCGHDECGTPRGEVVPAIANPPRTQTAAMLSPSRTRPERGPKTTQDALEHGQVDEDPAERGGGVPPEHRDRSADDRRGRRERRDLGATTPASSDAHPAGVQRHPSQARRRSRTGRRRCRGAPRRAATVPTATTAARTIATLTRRGSHVRIVVIVPVCHDAPTDDAPITSPIRIAMNASPRARIRKLATARAVAPRARARGRPVRQETSTSSPGSTAPNAVLGDAGLEDALGPSFCPLQLVLARAF